MLTSSLPEEEAVTPTSEWEGDLKEKNTHNWFKNIQQSKHRLRQYGI